jgi:1-acyl-sn-glycerol-3-phosphate acyltransferase
VRDRGLRRPDAAIAFSPATDAVLDAPSLRANIATDPMIGPAFGQLARVPQPLLLWYQWFTARLRPTDPRVSPLRGALHDLPPVLIQASDSEMLLDDARRYVAKAQAAGSPVMLQTWPEHVPRLADVHGPARGRGGLCQRRRVSRQRVPGPRLQRRRMNALRSAIVFAWMVVSIIPMGLALLLTSPFVGSDRLWWWYAVPWLRGVIGAARWVGGVDYRVRGVEHLPGAEDMRRVILVSKHQSTWETFFFPSMMPHPLAYVFKKELLRIPFLAGVWALEMVHIDRTRRSEAWNAGRHAGRGADGSGKWIIMFPEGTRSERGAQGVYKTGATRLAIATGAVLIPIAVASARCWPRRSFWFIPGRIEVSIGAPVESAGRKPEELMAELEGWIEGEMRVLDPDAYAGQGAAHA